MRFFINSLLVLTLVMFTTLSIFGQSITLLTNGTISSLRGLSVPDDQTIWVSGSNGTVGKSVNGGGSFEWSTVPGYNTRDFRDIEAFDANTAVIMAVDEPAIILRTTDGGLNWKKVYENKTPAMFLDAMDFSDDQYGTVIGDPINGRFFIARTNDSGKTWKDLPADQRNTADSGEACFASSGNNLRQIDSSHFVFISGGSRSRFYGAEGAKEIPLVQGGTSTGANAVAVWKKNLVIVGGDFSHDSLDNRNCAISHDGGRTWSSPKTAPHGYRSSVEYFGKKDLLACGTSGIDVSYDGGNTWKLVDKKSFHVCRKAKKGNSIFLAGSMGRVAKFNEK